MYDRLSHALTPPVKYNAPEFPNGMPKTTANLQYLATQNLRQAAAAARQDGIAVYAIGLGNPRVRRTGRSPTRGSLWKSRTYAMASIPSRTNSW